MDMGLQSLSPASQILSKGSATLIQPRVCPRRRKESQ